MNRILWKAKFSFARATNSFRGGLIMSSKTSTMFLISVGAILVGLAMTQNPRCKGVCEQVARNLSAYGIRGFLRFL